MNAMSSKVYWEQRYRAGGNSGAGSRGELAAWKAALINAFIAENAIADILDLGCGDGYLLSLLRVPDYTGTDVSPTALARCAAQFPRHQFVPLAQLAPDARADLVLSIDVIFHLVEDDVFIRYMHNAFGRARRFVLIHSSNFDSDWPSPHVRHRRFTDLLADSHPDWRLIAHLPNRHPFDPMQPDTTSFADFFVFGRHDESCRLTVP